MHTGYIVGQNGIILGTGDGGTNWNTQYWSSGNELLGDNDLYSVHFTNISTGWAVGRDGIILNTINGGQNWVQENNGSSRNLYSVYFPNKNTGWAVGSFGTILKYSNYTSLRDEPLSTSGIPITFELKQNFPNPFNPTTTIEFVIPISSEVILKIYNSLGKEVSTLVSERLSAGLHSYKWSQPAGIASGIYLYRLQAGNYVETKKMVLMR
jgi:hypothetical protein